MSLKQHGVDFVLELEAELLEFLKGEIRDRNVMLFNVAHLAIDLVIFVT